MQITVPFCYLPNSKAQVFDMQTCQRSQFQVNTLLQISQRTDFAYFITLLADRKEWVMHPDYHRPCVISWFDQDGSMHSEHIGVKRILRSIAFPQHTPAELSSVVYTSRCL